MFVHIVADPQRRPDFFFFSGAPIIINISAETEASGSFTHFFSESEPLHWSPFSSCICQASPCRSPHRLMCTSKTRRMCSDLKKIAHNSARLLHTAAPLPSIKYPAHMSGSVCITVGAAALFPIINNSQTKEFLFKCMLLDFKNISQFFLSLLKLFKCSVLSSSLHHVAFSTNYSVHCCGHIKLSEGRRRNTDHRRTFTGELGGDIRKGCSSVASKSGSGKKKKYK